jgi:hypothetical protein
MDRIHKHCKRSAKKKISKKEILYSTLIIKNFKEFTWWVKILLDCLIL